MSWIAVCNTGDVTEDFPKAVKVGEKELGIFKVEGEFFCLEDVCPHAYALLSDGFVEEGKVECPLHEAIFDIPTGKFESGPSCRDLQTFEVKVEGDEIFVKIEE